MSQSRYTLFINSTLANAIFQAFTILLNFVVVPLFVGKMGAEIYGIWILNFTIMGYLGLGPKVAPQERSISLLRYGLRR